MTDSDGFRGDGLEMGLVMLAAGSFLLGWVAFIGVEFGRFSAISTLSVGGGLIVLLGVLGYRRLGYALFRPWLWIGTDVDYKPMSIPFSTRMLPYWIEYLFLAGWLVIAIGLFFRPHQFITGGADAGVYVNLSAHIATTGGLPVENHLIKDMAPDAYDLFLRQTDFYAATTHYWQPAFYVTDQTGRLTPQFYHLHPTWQALGYGLSGLDGALYMTGYWALLSSLFFYLLLRRWLIGQPFSRLFAMAGLFGMTLNAIQAWFARYPTTEPLTQFMFVVGFFAFMVWAETDYKEWLWGGLAGVAWGSTFLVRIDTFFIWAVPLILIGYLFLRRDLTGRVWAFLLPLIMLPAHSVWHGWFFSRPYFLDIFEFIGRLLLRNGISVAIGLIVGIVILASGWFLRDTIDRLLIQYGAVLKVGVIVIVILLAAYAWFIRPNNDLTFLRSQFSGAEVGNYNHENLFRLGWYLSPVGVWSAVFGACAMIWYLHKRDWGLVVMGLLFSLIYIYDIRNNQQQIYAMRRYVPVVLPFFIASATYLFVRLAHFRYRFVSFLVAAVWLCGIVWSARGFVSQVDYVGVPAQLAETAAYFESPAIVVFSQPDTVGVGDFLGTPLYFLHGHDTFVWRGGADDAKATGAAISRWQADGYHIYWVALPNSTAWPLDPSELEPIGELDVSFSILEQSLAHKPTAVENPQWRGEIFQIQPLSE